MEMGWKVVQSYLPCRHTAIGSVRYCIKQALQREVQEYQDLKLTHWESEASLGVTVCRCYLHSSLGASTVEAETEALLPEYFSYCFQQSAISQ